ncbi:hypothetical protein TH25_15785 [Thalassospira profundimaris]|uniref:Phytanoyl-CoA dioxygenase n=1 Tax=Thalassospira profundimaris TaxID=502049 RepID=A0A367X025_9PROT|nr:phytanoyl-CoA dioxygenase family protein [Thalassospira profundimaris]RCK46987.1 hypothetical protein TH25_15785 [Thalassospira profundimaris]
MLAHDPILALYFLGHPAVISLGKKLCGENAVPIYLSAQFRTLGERNTINWHQDMVHDRQGPVYTVGLYLDDAKDLDGALRIIPGTQHSRANIAPLTNDCVNSQCIPARRGDIITHDVMLVHCSDNLTQMQRRRTLYVEFRSPEQALKNTTMTRDWIKAQQNLLGRAESFYRRARKSQHLENTTFPETITHPHATQIRLEAANYCDRTNV